MEDGHSRHVGLDNFGLLMEDEIGVVEEVDLKLGTHPQQCISSGQALKAMILNGLGFVCAPLYLFEEFFIGKATYHLIGEGIEPSHLNDDRLGRVLDKLYEGDLSELLSPSPPKRRLATVSLQRVLLWTPPLLPSTATTRSARMRSSSSSPSRSA